MNDRHLLAMADEHFNETNDDMEFFQDKVTEAIAKDEPLKYGALNQYSMSIDNCDLYDKVNMFQKQMMQAFVTNNDKELLKLIKVACKMEFDSLVDLIGD